MANLVDTASSTDDSPIWVDQVTQIGEDSGNNGLLLGSNAENVDNHSNLNRPFQELARRSRWLYKALEVLGLTPNSTPNQIKQALAGDAAQAATESTTLELGAASVAQGRLTLASDNPDPSSDITASMLYYTPYNGDLISIYNVARARWEIKEFTERSLNISGLAANTNYDIFVYESGGNLLLEAVAWASSDAGASTRKIEEAGVEIVRLNGVYVKKTDNRRYLGTIRTTSSVGECEDSRKKRLVWNVDNQVSREFRYAFPGAESWSYSGGLRQFGGESSWVLEFVCGLDANINVSGRGFLVPDAFEEFYVVYLSTIGQPTSHIANVTPPEDGVSLLEMRVNHFTHYHQILNLNRTMRQGYQTVTFWEEYLGTTGSISTVRGNKYSVLEGGVKA